MISSDCRQWIYIMLITQGNPYIFLPIVNQRFTIKAVCDCYFI